MLTVAQALTQVLENTLQLSPVRLPLHDALNHVLTESLTTPHDSPPFDKSMMDGFAISSTHVSDGESKTLNVIETITAGTLPTQSLGRGTASRIMTGAPMPDSADCVIPIEHTSFDEKSPEFVTISAEHVQAEQNVLRRGVSAQSGTPLIVAGTVLRPQHIAVLAEFGVAEVPVVPRPIVGVLATGDELIESSEALTPGRIRNSNEPMLVTQIRRAGGVPMPLGIARDDEQELTNRIAAGLQEDVLLLSGGVSAGMLDLVPAQLASAGVEQVFHGIHMKPGKPLWFGTLQRGHRQCLVFGLPGNPVSSMVCFEVFVRPALDQLAGLIPHGFRNRTATLTEDIKIRGDRPTYLPSTLISTEAGLKATPVAWGGSADLRSTAEANGVSCLDSGGQGYKVGDSVPVICWDEI
ncbi:MAG: molybdopterin molybdotransferase MoeA [Fuerstiella sp.]|nr:molybdopterin molybdotransferase MoeA [Fuerstiella sp.]